MPGPKENKIFCKQHKEAFCVYIPIILPLNSCRKLSDTLGTTVKTTSGTYSRERAANQANLLNTERQGVRPSSSPDYPRYTCKVLLSLRYRNYSRLCTSWKWWIRIIVVFVVLRLFVHEGNVIRNTFIAERVLPVGNNIFSSGNG